LCHCKKTTLDYLNKFKVYLILQTAKRRRTYDSIAFDCRTNLLGSRSNVKRGFCLQAVLQCLFSDIRASTHVLVGAIGAGTDQADFDFIWPAILLSGFAYNDRKDRYLFYRDKDKRKENSFFRISPCNLITQFRDRVSQVWRERSIHVRFQSR